MKLNEVKQYTLGVLRGAFTNKNILDDISAEGKNLRYKGNNLGDSYMFTGTENYIEDEQVIGRWIDGRPLYRKLYKGTGNWDSSMTNIIIESNFRSTKNYIDSKGYIEQTSGNSISINSAINTSSNGVMCWVVGSNLCFRNFSGGTVSAYYIFVEYTKQADAPDAEVDVGNQPMNFIDGGTYSENEVVIGQWIDGKPLYRKVYTVEKEFQGNEKAVADISILNIDTIVDTKAIVLKYNGNENFKSVNGYLYIFTRDKNTLLCNSEYGYTINSSKIIIEYTKTTDEPQDMSITSTLTTTATDDEVKEVFA